MKIETSFGYQALPRLQRARGSVLIAAQRRGARSALADLRQQGSAKALFPRGAGPMLDAVLLNTAGGIAGGDRFDYSGHAGPGAWLALTSQAAERAYRARRDEIATLTVRLSAATGARLDWLPQETILFDGAALARRLEIDLAGDARLLAAEAIVFGRAAHGERLSALDFSDQWRIRREGRLIFADALRLRGPAAEILDRSPVLDGAGAMASIVCIAPETEALLGSVRVRLPDEGAASIIRPGVLAARIVAPDSLRLRKALIPVLEILRRAPLPSIWKT